MQPVDLQMSIMKPLGAKWMMGLYDYIKVAGKLPHKRNNCFRFTPTIVQLVFLFE